MRVGHACNVSMGISGSGSAGCSKAHTSLLLFCKSVFIFMYSFCGYSLPFCISGFLPVIIFLLSEELPSVLFSGSLLAENSLSFACLMTFCFEG